MEYIYINVALPIPLFSTFTYKVRKEKINNFSYQDILGRRVLVPFKNIGLTGIVVDFSLEKPSLEVKEIFDFPDKEPVFNKIYIKIIKKLSDYYLSPIGMSFYYTMPEGLRWVYNPKTKNWIKKFNEEKLYRANVPTLSDLPKLSLKAYELLEFILENGEVSKEEIKEYGFSLNSLKTLLKKGLVVEESFFLKDRNWDTLNQPKMKDRLNIGNGFYVYTYETFYKRLKTYEKIINSNINQGKSSLIVLPNIEAIKKIYSYFSKIYGNRVFLYYDGLPSSEKVNNWFLLKKYKGALVIGSFSSLFIPIGDLKTIIIEEEYSESYKSKRTPKFDARRVAYQIFKDRENISLIFSSSVPSVESYYSIKKKLAKNLTPIKNLNRKGKIVIKEFKSFENIKKIVEETVNLTEKTLILANKRGYSSFLYCERCEEEILCNRCDTPVRIHKEKDFYLQCDLCSKKYQYITLCPTCEHPLKEFGFGIDKIVEILKSKKISFSFLEENKNTDVKLAVSLSGKDIISEEFDNVINIYPDFYLNLPDFRGEERFFRNIYLPFFKTKKRYILITNSKKSKAVESLLKKDPSLFLAYELKNRKEGKYPPFSKYILLTFEKKELSVDEVMDIFEKYIKENKIDIDYEGAYFAPYSKIRNATRIQILLKDFKEKEKLKNLWEITRKKGIKLSIDVDPKEIK